MHLPFQYSLIPTTGRKKKRKKTDNTKSKPFRDNQNILHVKYHSVSFIQVHQTTGLYKIR